MNAGNMANITQTPYTHYEHLQTRKKKKRKKKLKEMVHFSLSLTRPKTVTEILMVTNINITSGTISDIILNITIKQN